MTEKEITAIVEWSLYELFKLDFFARAAILNDKIAEAKSAIRNGVIKAISTP